MTSPTDNSDKCDATLWQYREYMESKYDGKFDGKYEGKYEGIHDGMFNREYRPYPMSCGKLKQHLKFLINEYGPHKHTHTLRDKFDISFPLSPNRFYTGTLKELNCTTDVMIEKNNPKTTEEKIKQCFSQK